MGLVLPWLVRALAQDGALAGNRAVWLYAVNTCGGVPGIGVTLLWLLPRLGLTGAALTAIAANALVGLAAFLGARTFRPAQTSAAPMAAERPDSTLAPSADLAGGSRGCLLAFCSGFLVLALEVIFQHQLAQVTINSLFSGGLVLALVLAALTLAAMLAPG